MFNDEDPNFGSDLTSTIWDEQILRDTISGTYNNNSNKNSHISGFVPQAPTVKRGNGMTNNTNDYLNRNSGGRRYGPGVYSGLLGSGYTLKGNPARFLLPETDNLSPAAAIAGKLDNWPANSNTSVIGASKALRPSANNNRQNGKKGKRRVIKKKGKIQITKPLDNKSFGNMCNNNNNNNSKIVHNNNVKETNARNAAAKPRFLKEIESFIESELTLLGLQKMTVKPAQHVFKYLKISYVIDDFKTYRPILSAIKNEYDMLLDKYAKRLHYIQPLKARLSTIQADVEQRMKLMTIEHGKERERMGQKISILTDSNENLKKLNKNLADDNLKITKELDVQRAKYLDMKTANLSLVASVKHKDETIADEALKLSNQIDRAKYLGLQVEQTEMKYSSARAEMKKLRNEINEMKAQAKVPEITPAQMLAVQKELMKAREDLEKGGKSFRKLQKDNTKLTVAVEELTVKRKELEKKLEKYENQNIQVFASKIVAGRMEQANIVYHHQQSMKILW